MAKGQEDRLMKISIIIPVHNTEGHVESCLNSLVDQKPGQYEKEVIFIDDASIDRSVEILRSFSGRHEDWVKLFRNEHNIGPGFSRNIGIDQSSGEWLLFLDSDDSLDREALSVLSEHLDKFSTLPDLLGFNWKYDHRSNIIPDNHEGRWDLETLTAGKEQLLKESASLAMDGSVIYTLMRKNLLIENGLRFRSGLHEDVDFIFKVYYFSNKNSVLNRALYIKNNRDGSIVNSISEAHIHGFFVALKEIYSLLDREKVLTPDLLRYYNLGVIRMISTEIRKIIARYGASEQADEFMHMIFKEYINLSDQQQFLLLADGSGYAPKYRMIAEYYIDLMKKATPRPSQNMANYLQMIGRKSWSCYDLQNSIFLSPDEIRTCCKRFFVGEKMKGDIVLLNGQKYVLSDYTAENILKEKQALYVRLNKGTADECSGCPYLRFDEWPPLKKLKVEYLSFEYSTVCNMKCVYCADVYYGGKKPKYDLEKLISQLFDQADINACKTVVWGGGEPTLDPFFNGLLTFVTKKLPDVQQRIFTNATIYSELIDKLIVADKVITITSVDAGCAETFYEIRKNRDFNKVLENLRRYSLAGAENMIIKFIITDKNRSASELQSYVSLIQQYSLERCNFQISVDFKSETVEIDSLAAAILLHGYLTGINVRFVFFDDLLWQRISNEYGNHLDRVIGILDNLKMRSAFIEKGKYESVVIWGAGIQARFLIEKAALLKDVNISFMVDNSPLKIGKKYLGYDVYDPKVLLDNDYPVIIAAVQNTPAILREYERLGLPKSRLIKQLVI